MPTSIIAVALDDRIKQIIVEQLNVKPEQVAPDARFQEDLGADSLDVVELSMQFEENFNIVISDTDAKSLMTMKDAIRYIEKTQKPV